MGAPTNVQHVTGLAYDIKALAVAYHTLLTCHQDFLDQKMANNLPAALEQIADASTTKFKSDISGLTLGFSDTTIPYSRILTFGPVYTREKQVMAITVDELARRLAFSIDPAKCESYKLLAAVLMAVGDRNLTIRTEKPLDITFSLGTEYRNGRLTESGLWLPHLKPRGTHEEDDSLGSS